MKGTRRSSRRKTTTMTTDKIKITSARAWVEIAQGILVTPEPAHVDGLLDREFYVRTITAEGRDAIRAELSAYAGDDWVRVTNDGVITRWLRKDAAHPAELRCVSESLPDGLSFRWVQS